MFYLYFGLDFMSLFVFILINSRGLKAAGAFIFVKTKKLDQIKGFVGKDVNINFLVCYKY